MVVIATVGLPGSGKGEFANVANELGFEVISGGDLTRQEVQKRDLKLSDTNVASATEDLRREHGDAAIASLVLEHVKQVEEELIVVDSIRTPSELAKFRQNLGDNVKLVLINSRFENRASRLIKRGREDDIESKSDLKERDERELSWGYEELRHQAEIKIENNDSLSAFQSNARKIINQVLDARNGR